MKTFDTLIDELFKRDVKVSLAVMSGRLGRAHYKAVVETATSLELSSSWPVFQFTILGQSMDDVVSGIEERLPLVEPIIKAREEHKARQWREFEGRGAHDAVPKEAA
ncbi:hypothetical protein [Ancylobacter polymorphus]|uniref:Uncharacterized protein n=1 Tax=Ancylobacter polymorphus TaxID=223390 RepID=A0A9E7A6K5_9HYPH|nr:hypothetical protein [Ancylobacter polymorphus]UOK71734.1 hypothetical protein K9D25_03125 [Ancylobacter polymorphus]